MDSSCGSSAGAVRVRCFFNSALAIFATAHRAVTAGNVSGHRDVPELSPHVFPTPWLCGRGSFVSAAWQFCANASDRDHAKIENTRPLSGPPVPARIPGTHSDERISRTGAADGNGN